MASSSESAPLTGLERLEWSDFYERLSLRGTIARLQAALSASDSRSGFQAFIHEFKNF